MQFTIKKLLLNLLITSLTLSTSTSVLGLKSDGNQSLIISSIKQSVDIKNGVSTFTDNVMIKQGTLEIRADKVIVDHAGNNENSSYIIKAFGDPVIFYQMQDNGNPIRGRAGTVYYDIAIRLITLTDRPKLEQIDNSVSGDRITYLVKQNKIQVFSDKGKRVITVLMPSRLQDKNR